MEALAWKIQSKFKMYKGYNIPENKIEHIQFRFNLCVKAWNQNHKGCQS